MRETPVGRLAASGGQRRRIVGAGCRQQLLVGNQSGAQGPAGDPLLVLGGFRRRDVGLQRPAAGQPPLL